MKSTLTRLNWGKKIKITDCCTEKANKYSKSSNGEVSTATGNVASRTKGTLCQDKLSEVPHWLSTSHTFLASWTLQKHLWNIWGRNEKRYFGASGLCSFLAVIICNHNYTHQNTALPVLEQGAYKVLTYYKLTTNSWKTFHWPASPRVNAQTQWTQVTITASPTDGGCHYHKARAKWALAWCKRLHR